MATADLEAELKKDTFKMDADSEKKITNMVIKLLEDNSNQVQELVVKWYVFLPYSKEKNGMSNLSILSTSEN